MHACIPDNGSNPILSRILGLLSLYCEEGSTMRIIVRDAKIATRET